MISYNYLWMNTLLYIWQITNKDLLYNTGNSTWYYAVSYIRKEYKKEWTYVSYMYNWITLLYVCVCVCVSVCLLSHIQLFVTQWTVARQAPLSMEFSRQEYWSGLLFSPPGDLPNPGIKPTSLVSPTLAGGFFTTEPPRKPTIYVKLNHFSVYLKVTQSCKSIMFQ